MGGTAAVMAVTKCIGTVIIVITTSESSGAICCGADSTNIQDSVRGKALLGRLLKVGKLTQVICAHRVAGISAIHRAVPVTRPLPQTAEMRTLLVGHV